MRWIYVVVFFGAALGLGANCGSIAPAENGFGSRPTVDPVDTDELCVTEGLHRCRDGAYEVCASGEWAVEETCGAPTPLCVAETGCAACNPDRTYCVGEAVHLCSGDGLDLTFDSECGFDEQCQAGSCRNACEVAEAQRSYLGCEFLAVATSNLVDPAFDDDFAVVIGNPHPTAEAQVVISRDGASLRSVRVPPQSTEALSLSVVPELKGFTNSVVARGGAFEVTSSLPVAAYQFNPLNFRVETDAGPLASFTNDASLLLPVHALSGHYRINTHPSFGILQPDLPWQWLPGFVAVAATQDDTTVTFSSNAYTLGGDVAAVEPGGSRDITLNRGDVVQLLSRTHDGGMNTDLCKTLGGRGGDAEGSPTCFDDAGGDLTGSVVTADADVAVWAGHTCSFMPVDSYACDHLEEMMFPRATLGDLLVMTAPDHPSRSGQAPAVYRVMSAIDNNFITFTPSTVAFDRTVNAGEFIEFTTDTDFVVLASGAVHVTQSLVGQRELVSTAGDPAMGSGVPLSQYRSEYDFLAPDTYTTNHINVTARDGTVVYLDGLLVEGWDDVAGSNYAVARLQVEGGPHHIESLEDAPFGITSYGYADFTSYLTPGGMNFVR
jgi:hypothetical protein